MGKIFSNKDCFVVPDHIHEKLKELKGLIENQNQEDSLVSCSYNLNDYIGTSIRIPKPLFYKASRYAQEQQISLYSLIACALEEKMNSIEIITGQQISAEEFKNIPGRKTVVRGLGLLDKIMHVHKEK